MDSAEWSVGLSSGASVVLRDLLSQHAETHAYGGRDGFDWEADLGAFMNQKDEFRRLALELISTGCMNVPGTHRLMAMAWAGDNSPEAEIPARDWLRAFETSGYVSDDPWIPAPVDELTLFRGAPSDRRCGLAWTEEKAKARDFAEFGRGSGGEGLVFVAQVAPRRVLARFNLHDERECVLDTRGLVMSLIDTDGGSPLDPCSDLPDGA
jgi:hypothetical protein